MKPADPADISLKFYRALDSVDKTFEQVLKQHPEMATDVRYFRRWMEEVADDMIAIAARIDWQAAYMNSGWRDFQRCWEKFMGEVFP